MSAKGKTSVIEQVVINVAGTRLELTIEQAKELRDILNGTFPTYTPAPMPIIIERDRYEPERPYPWYTEPMIRWTVDTTPTHNGDILCLNAN